LTVLNPEFPAFLYLNFFTLAYRSRTTQQLPKLPFGTCFLTIYQRHVVIDEPLWFGSKHMKNWHIHLHVVATSQSNKIGLHLDSRIGRWVLRVHSIKELNHHKAFLTASTGCVSID